MFVPLARGGVLRDLAVRTAVASPLSLVDAKWPTAFGRIAVVVGGEANWRCRPDADIAWEPVADLETDGSCHSGHGNGARELGVSMTV